MDLELNNETSKRKASKTLKTKVKKAKRPKATSTEGHYVTNSVLLPEIIRAKGLGKVTPELAEMFYKIATKYISSKNFSHLNFKDDLVGAVVLSLLSNGLKFNPEKSDQPFSYLTQCSYHAALQYIAAEKKQRDIRDQLMVNDGLNASLTFMESERDEYRMNHSDVFGED
jgi:hypothetical protein